MKCNEANSVNSVRPQTSCENMRCHEYDCYSTDSSNHQIKPHKEWEAHPNRGDESEHEHLMPFMHQHCALGPERPKCTELWRSYLTNTSLLQSQGIFRALTTENWKSYKEFESVPQASTPLWGNLRNCKCCLVETHTSWWCHKGRPHTSHTPHISTHLHTLSSHGASHSSPSRNCGTGGTGATPGSFFIDHPPGVLFICIILHRLSRYSAPKKSPGVTCSGPQDKHKWFYYGILWVLLGNSTSNT